MEYKHLSKYISRRNVNLESQSLGEINNRFSNSKSLTLGEIWIFEVSLEETEWGLYRN